MVAWSEFTPVAGLTVRILAGNAGIRRVEINPSAAPPPGAGSRDHPLLADAAHQLKEYFDGKRRAFAVPLELQGTEFQRRVWRTLDTIPYGETRSYRWLAAAAGCPRGFQAVGQANGSNPAGIIVPCHRVIAADGSLGGYAAGLEVKRKLLQLEAVHAGRFMQAATR
jgi:methylated-DNA-[protein]-cysteine S-methyltransferase